MTDTPGENVLVLSPAASPIATVGSIHIKAQCGHMCWISLNAQHAMKDDPTLVTQCLTCFQAEDLDDDVLYATLPGAAFELSEVLGIPLDQIDAHIERGIDTLKAQHRAQRA